MCTLVLRMDSRSSLGNVILKDFDVCKRQVECLWTDIDEICVNVIKNAVVLCFKSPKGTDSNEVSTETKIHPEPIGELLQEEPAFSEEQLSKAPAPKKLKLSLHSRKCEHSPHNRRKKGNAEVNEKVVSTLVSTTQNVPMCVSETPSAAELRPNMETPKNTRDSKVTNTTFNIVKSATRSQRPSSSVKSTQDPPEATLNAVQLPTMEMSSTQQKVLEAEVNLPKALATQSPHVATDSVAGSVPSGSKKTSLKSDSLDTLPAQCAVVEASTVSTELKAVASPPVHRNSNTFNESISSNYTEDGLARIKTSKQTSLGTQRSLSVNEVRPFSSVERLGGMSRLGNLTSTTNGQRNSKSNRISQKCVSNTSLLNESKSGVSRPTERSQSVLAMKEQMLAEKQRIYRERLKENADRLRVFQEARQREREAQKRANEERRLAVKQKAQQLAEMQRAIAENKMRLEVARAQGEHEKQKVATGTKPGCISRINEKENQPLSHTRPPPVSRTAQPQPVASKLTPNTSQPMVRLQPLKPPSAVLKPIQPTHPPVPAVTTVQATPKPTAAISVPVSAQPCVTVAQLNATQMSAKAVTQPSVVAEQLQPNLDSSTANETFDMSQLKSDSESDSEQPTHKIPSWSRKGNQNIIDALRLIYSGKCKWPSELLTASEINFDLDEVFRGFKFTRRPRTSSGVWNTVSGQFARDH